MAGRFVVSLDFELRWGIRDVVAAERADALARGVWEAIPAMLDLFAEHGVRATWATVGFLFAESRDELREVLPDPLPVYDDPRLSPYPELEAAGADERADPVRFAPSLIRRIAATDGQEIGTHTLSHFYCLERGPTVEDFRRDLRGALALAGRRGLRPRSLVFPRNQYGPDHLAAAAELGIRAFRSTTPNWMYDNRPTAAETRRRRAARLLDHYVPVAEAAVGGPSPVVGVDGLVDVPASRFLRPWSPALRGLEPLRLRRIRREMREAVEADGLFHLWWHPHNFGENLAQNLSFLRGVLREFTRLRDERGFTSATMGDVAQA